MLQFEQEILPAHDGSAHQKNNELVELAYKRGGSVRLLKSLEFAQSKGILDGLTIQAVVSGDVHTIEKLMRIPNFGAKCLSELKQIALLESEVSQNKTDLSVSRPDVEELVNHFSTTGVAPNLPFQLSGICINVGLLSESEKKVLKRIENMFGKMDLQSFLTVDEKLLLERGSFGAKYLPAFHSLRDFITDELLGIVEGRKKLNFRVKNLFVTSEYFYVELSEIDQILLDDVEEYLFSLDDESRDIIMSRWGFHCKKESLEELGGRYNITRERIRQRATDITNNFLPTTRIHSVVIRENIIRQGAVDFGEKFKNLTSCFEDERHFYSFLETLCQVDKGHFSRLEPSGVKATFLDAYFCENTSPVNRDVLIGELVSSYGCNMDQAISVLLELQNKSKLQIIDNDIFPLNLGKIESVAHILMNHPNGLPWRDIAKIINRMGCCSTLMDDNVMHNWYFGDSNYVYLCDRGTYRHINFLNMSKIEVPKVMEDIREYFSSQKTDSIHLNDFYHQAKPCIKAIDYFDFRHVVREFSSEYGFYFNGKSGVDGLGIVEKFNRKTQQELILDIMNKAKGAITKVEVAERLRSKSIGHANFYLQKMIESGDVVRIDHMMYTTPDKAFVNIDTERILFLMNEIMADTSKVIESDVFRLKINNALNLGYTKYFYAALASINLDKFAWSRKHNLFSRCEIPYQSLNDAFASLCNPAFTNADNLEILKQEIEMTDQVAEVGIRNWRVSNM